MASGDRYVYTCGQWCSEAITDCVYGFGVNYSAALIPNFSCAMWSHPFLWLLDGVPDEQSDLSCPWNSRCCVMYSEVDSFFCPMNFNNFSPPLCIESFTLCLCSAGYYSSYYLSQLQSPHVLWRNKAAEKQSNIETMQGMSISSNQLRGQCFSIFFLQGRISLMSNLRSNKIKMCSRQPVLSDNGWGRSECVNVLNSQGGSCFKIYVNLFKFAFNPMIWIYLSAAAAITLSIKSVEDKSEDAKSVHQNLLVICY